MEITKETFRSLAIGDRVRVSRMISDRNGSVRETKIERMRQNDNT